MSSSNKSRLEEEIYKKLTQEGDQIPNQFCWACRCTFICEETLTDCPVEGCESIGTVEYFH